MPGAPVREHPGHIDPRALTGVRAHRTEDPETVVAGARGPGRTVGTGRSLGMNHSGVPAFRDRTMTACRDHRGPLGTQQPGTGFHGTDR